MSLAPIPEPDTTLGGLKLTDYMYSAEALSCALSGVAGRLDSASTGLDEFSDKASYSVGVFVSYAGRVYKCTAAHSAGEWNSAHFKEVEVLFNHTQHGNDTGPLAIGQSSSAGPDATAIGRKTSAGDKGVALGANDANSSTQAGVKGVAIGCGAKAGSRSTAIGDKSNADKIGAIAIGGTRSVTDIAGAQATAEGACQIGYSDSANNTPNSLRFRDTVVVDGDGKIPASSLGEGAARILSMTQEQYDHLSEYDENTIYVIVNG